MKKIISILVVVCFLLVICIVRISFLEESADLALIDGIGKENIELIDIFKYENSQNLLLENINKDELLDNVVEVLVQNGFDDLKLLYDGTCDFIHRKYYVVSSANDLKDHIIREQTLYIDMENGYIYQAYRTGNMVLNYSGISLLKKYDQGKVSKLIHGYAYGQ